MAFSKENTPQGRRKQSEDFSHGSRFRGKGKRGREFFDFYCGGWGWFPVILPCGNLAALSV
jgi:hypothetical protein